MRRQERRAAESGIRGQVLDHDRPGRAKHIPGVRVRIRSQHRAPDGAVTPTDTATQQQRAALGTKLEHARERHLEHAGHDRHGAGDQLVGRGAGQRALADVGHGFLVAGRGAQLRLRPRHLLVANGVVLPQQLEPARAHV